MRSRLIYSFVLLALVLSGVAVAGAAETESLAELKAGLETRFDLLPLSDGVLLRSLDGGPGPLAVEVSGSTIAIDGEAVGTDELRARLGTEAAGWVLAVADLDEAGRRELLAAPVAMEADAPREAGAVAEALEAEDEAQDEAGEEAAEESARASADEDVREKRRSKPRRSRRTGDSEVAFAGSLTVEKDEVTDDVLVVGGFLKVEGRVEGDATVIGGSANIEGVVEGDVTAIGGPVRLEDGSVVEGDVTSVGGRVYRDDGARVEGTIEQVPFNADFKFGPWTDWKHWQRYGSGSQHFDFNPWGWWTGVGWKLVEILFLAAFAWIFLLVARTPIERMERRIEAEPWKTGLVGLLAIVLFVPTVFMLSVFLAISIVGIPLLLLLPFALIGVAIVGWLGLIAVAGRVGSWARERFNLKLDGPFWVVLVGFALLASLSVVGELLDFGVAPMRFIAAIFGFFGGIVCFAAAAIACGSAVLTRFGTADSWSRAEDFVAPLPPVPTLHAEADEAEPAPDWDNLPPDEPVEPFEAGEESDREPDPFEPTGDFEEPTEPVEPGEPGEPEDDK